MTEPNFVNFIREAEKIKKLLIKWRRDFHQYPELGFEEKRTAQKIEEKLNSWGLSVERKAKTGVVALINGAEGGKTVAIRADIDALPLQEENKIDYKSRYDGKMHACGHDAHISIVLGVAKILSQNRNKLKGNVKFIFQPAEESPGGAKPMIEEGVLKDPVVDAIFALHVDPAIPVGKIGIKKGPVMAASDLFKIIIKGSGSHGAKPENGVDPIVIGSQVVMALQQLVSREYAPQEPLVLSCGTFDSGSNFNIIPDSAEITGTVRTLSEPLRREIKKRIGEIVAGITGCLRADYELEYKFLYPVTYNDPGLTELAAEVIKEMPGEGRIYNIPYSSMGAEDFAYFSQEVAANYLKLGTKNSDKGVIHPLHNSCFNIDEDILPIGVELFCRLIVKCLNREGGK